MSSVRIRMHVAARDPDRFPEDDAALGASLFAMLGKALQKGLPRPAFLVLRDGQVEQIDALPLLRLPQPRSRHMLAAAAGQDGVECVALVAPLTLRTGPKTGARAAVVFVEWPDNRWWTAWQPLDDDRNLLGEGPAVRSAEEGWPKPGGVGGWFAMSRRLSLKLRVQPLGEDEGGPTVH